MSSPSEGPKILLYDIETAPNLGYIWGKYEQDVLEFEREWYILTFAYKWLGEKTVHAFSLPDFPRYKRDREDDKHLVTELWKLMDEADVVIGHNSDEFDNKKAYARFIAHGMNPPRPFKMVDTKKAAKKYFNFNSNKLDDLGNYFGLGRKIQTGGFDLWKRCMQGDPAAWKKMVDYNKQDVALLEKVYYKLRPWTENHVNLNLYNEDVHACPKCSSGKIQRRGFRYGKTGRRRQYQCTNCGGWCVGHSEKLEFVLR